MLVNPAGLNEAPWRAIAGCDSVVVDPHKHGLQPYGCGAVLFRDPDVGRFYLHDSPYTYFTSDELHLGEISLECSRAGASAAALWLTLQLLPLTREGLGPWSPVIEGDRLYGRGGADDGYAIFGCLAAITALKAQQVEHSRCVVMIEKCRAPSIIRKAMSLQLWSTTASETLQPSSFALATPA